MIYMIYLRCNLILLTSFFVEKIPYGKFSIGKSLDAEYSMKDFMVTAATNDRASSRFLSHVLVTMI